MSKWDSDELEDGSEPFLRQGVWTAAPWIEVDTKDAIDVAVTKNTTSTAAAVRALGLVL